jgi:hypothetical protein
MQKLKEIFKTIRNDFRSVVPPLYAVVNEEHHYEVWADYKEKKTFFGRVIMHQDTVELSFYADITRETMWTLFPGDIFKRMEQTFDCQIMDLSPELNANINEVIDNLIDYFRMEQLLGPPLKF